MASTSNRSHQRYVREANHILLANYSGAERPIKKAKMSSDGIVFTKEDAKGVHWPHNDVIVIRAKISNVEVRWIMIDTGSSVNVMYRECYDQMGLGAEQLTPSSELLYGFTGDVVISSGRIRLPLTLGEPGRQAITMTDFLIINSPSAYNVVLWHPSMNELDMVTSTRAPTVKFPTSNGIGYVRGEQHLARWCYEDAVKMGVRGKKVNVVSGGEPQAVSETGVSGDLDPREVDTNKVVWPVES